MTKLLDTKDDNIQNKSQNTKNYADQDIETYTLAHASHTNTQIQLHKDM